MRKLAQFTDKDDLSSFMQKEYNDLVRAVQNLKSSSSSNSTINLTDLLPVSMIILSGAPDESTFQGAYGSDWVLADGRNVQGSAYHKLTGFTNVPDMRGRYPRGRSFSTGRNPDGDLAVGVTQEDEFKSHTGHVLGTAAGGTYTGGNSTDWANRLQGGNETRPKTVVVNFFVKIN